MIHLLYLLSLISSIRSSDYSLVIDEKSPIDKAIYRFSHPYELLNNFQSNFNLTNNNRELILTKAIDRDAWCSQNLCSCDSCSFILEFFSNEQSMARFFTMNITINDINDHACQFLDVQTNISLSESIPVGHRFVLAHAIDSDSGQNGQLTFELLQREDYFHLDIVTLATNEYAIYAIVNRSLDREVQDTYELIVQAYDHGSPQAKFNQTKIHIDILDENDNAPKFSETEYSIQSLPENTPVGTELLRISASDADKDSNGLVHYSMINSPSLSSFPFAIQSLTGVVTLRSPLDYETTHSYRFLIRASDSGSPQPLFTDTWLSVSIEDVNDCPVEILFVPNRRFPYENQTLSIYENTDIKNLTLGYIRLFDRDSVSNKLSISLSVFDQQPKQEFEIIPSNQLNSFVLIAKRGFFDREIQSDIELRFIATDTLLTSIYDFKIHLLDLNDNPSEFSTNPLRFHVEETADYRMVERTNADYQFTLGYLNATDRDQGDNARVTYDLEPNAFVKVDAETGRIYLVQPLDREQVPKIELRAKAINVAEPKWITDVQILIEVSDVNDNIPRCLNPHHRLTIPENVSIEQALFTVNASDSDNGNNGTINYSLRTNGTWPFKINPKTGQIYSRETFDYESTFKSFSLVIDLEDNGLPTRNRNGNACQIEIILEDINDNRPELVDNRQTEIFLDLQREFLSDVIQLNLTDRDSGNNGKIQSNLQSIESSVQLSSNQSLFQLNANGSLQIISPITEVSLFKLRILLEDFGEPSEHTLILITIAVGDSSRPEYSSFEKVQLFFDEKRSSTSYFAFVFGLTVLAITFLLLTTIVIVCLLIRQYRRRRKIALTARNKLLCTSSQQLTISDSTIASNAASSSSSSSSSEHQQIIRTPLWTDRSPVDQSASVRSSSSESRTYKILHIPVNHDRYIHYYEKEKIDNVSCDHGYQGSYHTQSSSSSTSPEQFSSQISIRRESTVNQLPYFVTKCKSLADDFIVEMNVDGSDEDPR